MLEIFFGKCNDVIFKSMSRHLMNANKTIRRETVKSIHHMFLSDFKNGKESWFNKFMPIILGKLSTEEYAVKEEVYKLLDSTID